MKQRNEKVKELKSVLETLFKPEVIKQKVSFGQRRQSFHNDGTFKTEYGVELDVQLSFYLPVDQSAEWEKDIRTIVEEIKYETNARIDAEALIQEHIQAFAYAESFERYNEWIEQKGEKAVEKYQPTSVRLHRCETLEPWDDIERRKINDL